ncbi:MAG: acylphosphatase, partial [Methanosarcinales archaeon]
MMKRARIIVKGKVQRAGYRDLVEEFAYYSNLKGYVKNLEDGTVEIVCEGEETKIKDFIENIKIREFPIIVEDVDVTYSNPTGEFKDFKKIREEDFTEAIYERLDTAARYLRVMNKNLGDKIDSGNKMLAEKIDTLGVSLGNKIDSGNKMLAEKIDTLGV